MPQTQTAEIAQGIAAWLIDKMELLVPSINADLATKVVTNSQPPVFQTMLGNIPNTPTPYMAVSMKSLTRNRIADNEKTRAYTFHVACLIPIAGDDTAMNFEMTSQVASDWVNAWFDTDANALTPKINAGLLGVVNCMEAELGDQADLFPTLMMDGKTAVRGWRIPYIVKIGFQTR